MESYLVTPNLPKKSVCCVVADSGMDEQAVRQLQTLGIRVIPTVEVSALQLAVSGHADMMLHHLGGNRFAVAREVHAYYQKCFPDAVMISGTRTLKSDYPYDILYNCTALGQYVIGNLKNTADEIVCEAETFLNVKQGYSKCSTCIVSEHAVITADLGIAEQCRKNGIEVLTITPGFIELPGVNYGFIGGATGLLAPDLLAVNGELKTHPDGESIRAFCKMHGVSVCELKKGYIMDVGSILPILEC